jgi:hypothetical protein
MNLDFFADKNIEQNKIFFRTMRNDIVGSSQNKLDYIRNNHFKK